jgi:hypothetical protein
MSLKFSLESKHSSTSQAIRYIIWSNPVVSCGAEAWTMRKKEEQAVLIFERKIFRRIYGPKYNNNNNNNNYYYYY